MERGAPVEGRCTQEELGELPESPLNFCSDPFFKLNLLIIGDQYFILYKADHPIILQGDLQFAMPERKFSIKPSPENDPLDITYVSRSLNGSTMSIHKRMSCSKCEESGEKKKPLFCSPCKFMLCYSCLKDFLGN